MPSTSSPPSSRSRASPFPPRPRAASRAAARSAGAGARGAADQRRARLALRHLGPLHRSGSGDRRPSRLGQRAQCLDRRARRHRELRGPHASGARRRRHPCRPRCPAHRRTARRRRRPAAHPAPRQGRCQRDPDALCAARHRDARDGIRGPARERPPRMDGRVHEGFGARGAPARQSDGRQHSEDHHARIRARRGGARARDHSGQHQSPGSRADGDRAQLQGQDQRQHRQFGRHLQHRGRSGEAGPGRSAGVPTT